jgi:hypothetical protein
VAGNSHRSRCGKRAADAAIGVELPKLTLFHLDFADLGGRGWITNLMCPTIEVKVKNYGRTPAFIMSEGVEIVVGFPSERPDYSRTAHDLPPETVVESGQPFSLAAVMPSASLSTDQVNAIVEGRPIFWVFGYVAYRDFLNEPHIARFCRQLWFHVSDDDVDADVVIRWIDGGAPAAYTESW